MHTSFTQRFGVDLPLVCPGMSYIATTELVAAVANAGGLGILASGPLGPDATRAAIRRIRQLTNRPFGVGCTLLMPGSADNARVAIEEQVPAINYSLGKGEWIAEAVHAYGGKVIATVTSEKHARSAEGAGADALLVTGHEAAAHGGAVTSLALIPVVRAVSDLPVIAAGGFANGAGLAAALTLGADAVAMGSRIATTRESPLHDRSKAAIVERGVADTLYSRNFDGLPCRVMDTQRARSATRRPLPLPLASLRSVSMARQMGMSPLKVALGGLLQNPWGLRQLAQLGAATDSIRRAVEDGDLERGVQLIGQSQGLITDVPTVAELFARVMAEANASHARAGTLLQP